MLKPRQPVPALDVPLVGGGRWVLAEQRPERFSVVVFYRGVHCQMCKDHITELDALVDKFAEVGATSVLAVSGDDEGRAARAVEEWGLGRVPVGYGLSPRSMREWGLYISKAIKEGQPNEFSEPGLFVIRPDGTLYAVVQTSFPFLRPHLDEVLDTLRWVGEHDYPARGEV
ncbi:peroxiredoxin-like family protein [Saccharothrix luteola]|uniref:peroxiredoxin-like family protein n=1 Tax=Saccharothrix luteola TaxID=2893018 RepID=UPI001E519DFD|nr:peroxiredoxin-like family protein [Saccharothrix luteola]MCC8247058.1 AhpC/TSA family protein [Saccharothrix luteola]MCC8249901.1 AhpC/TSA family protein [Saccharothrix luteola]